MPRKVWLQLALLGVAGICLALLLPMLAPKDPLLLNLSERLRPPSATYWVGTDELGRDVASRLLIGIGATMSAAMLALAAATVFGLMCGAVAGYFVGRWPDHVFNAVSSVVAALPPLLVVVAVLGVVGSSLTAAYIVMAAIMWVTPARLMRQAVRSVVGLDYVSASRLAGKSDARLLLHVVLPNCLQSPMTASMAMLTEVIALEAGLSFLGLGVQPPAPSLGRMIFEGLSQISSAWWLTFAPAGALAALILSFSLLFRPRDAR